MSRNNTAIKNVKEYIKFTKPQRIDESFVPKGIAVCSVLSLLTQNHGT